MTAQPHVSAFRSGEGIDDFYALRSELIDEFARLELAVSLCLVALDRAPDTRKTTLRHRLVELSKAKPGPNLSKPKAQALGSLPQACEPLQRLRASIVHGVMELGSRDGEPIALFHNVADIVSDEPVCHALARSDFRHSIESVRAMAHQVENSLNRPVSKGNVRRPKAQHEHFGLSARTEFMDSGFQVRSSEYPPPN